MTSIFGDVAHHSRLSVAAPRNHAELVDALGRLADAGIVFQRGARPCHLPIKARACARRGLCEPERRRRRDLHARIAALLETSFPEIVEAQPELAADHFIEAGRSEQAIAYWQRADERAAARSANTEAIAHFRKARAMLAALPEGPQRDRSEMEIQMALGWG